uniref:Mitogen-activated protein kinase kinase kinase 1 n=1 Tax=Biomphalaria glabrata TaxID=6526 RepID=A0A2C9K5L3_BIOGL
MASICTNNGPAVESSSASTSAASVEYQYIRTESNTIHLEPSPSIICENCNKGAAYEETFQGPHTWRKILRHVPSTKRARKSQTQETNVSDNGNRTQSSNSMHFDNDNEITNQDLSELQSQQLDHSMEQDTPDAYLVQGDQEVSHFPPWKKEFIEKSNYRKMFKQSTNSLVVQASQIPVTVRRRGSLHGQTESAFTRQVVNSTKKKLSPSNSFRQAISNTSAHPGRRIVEPKNMLAEVSTNVDVTKKRIERVQRARLYLLQQTGPNSFLIGGDSPDHKYRVIIGPQTCSCGRGPHCVHVLFVMLRVFQVVENDTLLWNKTLKNYEVENLFRSFHDKLSSRITKRRTSQRRKEIIKQEEGEEERTVDTQDVSRLPSESDAGSVREEEEICPICLLEMLEGESLICCDNGCHNRLHHHCIAIWFEECRRQNDPLNCPLCRAQWKSTTVEIKSTQSSTSTDGPASSNTRSSSPHHLTSEEDSSRLPYAEPIPAELELTAAPWVEALGADLVGCLLSRNWSIREAGLKHLSKEVVATLLKGAGEGRSGVIVSPVRQEATHNMLKTACNILAYTCADPVYRVFVASLRAIRTLLSYTPCRDMKQRTRLQKVLKPIIEAIILKCTDGNRRTSQLSLSTLVELVKGQEGELAVGREIINPGNEGLDGLNYVLKCVTEDYDKDSVTWQWLLGRLYVLDRLLEEFPTEFVPRPEEARDAAGAAEADDEAEIGAAAGPCEARRADSSEVGGASNYERLMSVAHFSVKAVCSTHMRIARMSRRVFLLSAKLGAHVQKVILELKTLLSQIDSTSVASLRRKLDRIVEDFQLSERIVYELMHGSWKQGKLNSPCHTPMDSPSSTPRCNSPENAPIDLGVHPTINKEPSAPPTTPVQRSKRKLKRGIPRRSFREPNCPPAPPPTLENSPEKVYQDHLKENVDASNILLGEGAGVSHLGSASPPNRRKSNLPRRRRTIEGETVKNKRGGSSSPTIVRRRTTEGCTYTSNVPPPQPAAPQQSRTTTRVTPLVHPVPVISVTDTSGQETGNFSPLSDLDENSKDSNEETDGGNSKPLNIYETIKVSTSSHLSDHVTFCPEDVNHKPSAAASNVNSTCCCQCRCHESASAETGASTPKSGAAGVPNSPDSHYHTAEHESMSSDDFLDFSQSTKLSSNEKPVSFKSEVAESPKSSPSHSVHSATSTKSEECSKNCKEEVEREEAEALAKALDVSERQDPCPVVPGLTPTAREEVITIRIQPDDECDDRNGECRQPTMYLEKVHWVKGPLLGTGAYSSCYQARDVRTGVIMAVKQISFCRNSAQEQEKVIEAISEEIHMMARLSHPNIVRILGATKQGCHFNMFVEWMPGGSVAYLLGEYGAFTENVIVNYTRQVLRGLAYLHDNHILHRDLKGANLLIDSTGQTLRIGDFGASARLASQATGAGEFQGQLLGTIAFMAPEVLRGESYGRACDIWSVGCVMIEMATTKPPWNATDISNHLALIFKIASSVDSPPIPENLPPPIRDLMLRCLEQNSEDRPSAKDLLVHPLFTQCFTTTHNMSNHLNGSKLANR